MKVPFLDLQSQHQLLKPELLRKWDEILNSAAFIGGAAVENFEHAFAEFCGTRYAIGVGNGTDALTLALAALGIGEGDEVILPANSFVATAEAVVHAGATPVFAEINSHTYTIDVNQIEDRITPRTRALIPVHIYGQPADMDPILDLAARHDLKVIEDSAQAHGARYRGRRAGSMGDAGCFSFYPSKNLGACGDGGAVVTNDSTVAENVRRFRDHGGLRKYEHTVVGYNSRLDAVQAAALELKLKYLDERNAVRRCRAAAYNDFLSAIDGIITPFRPEGIESVYHLYVVRVNGQSRDELQKFLAARDIQTGVHYPAAIHRTPAFARFRADSCPIAEKYSSQILSLPMYPEIELEQLEYVASSIQQYVEAEETELMMRQ